MRLKDMSKHTDRRLIFASAGLRAGAVSISGVILALHLSTIGWNPLLIGFTISLGLLGCALGTLAVTLFSDRFGRRQSLFLLSMLMAVGGIIFAFASHASLLILGALIGMLNGMGRDRGAGLTIEQSILPQTTNEAERTKVFAWYNLTIDAGHAVGALLSSLPAVLRFSWGVSLTESYRWGWCLYSLLCVASGLLVLYLSPEVELKSRSVSSAPLSPQSRTLIVRFAALSGLDSLGGGFLTTALLSYWFFKRFGVNEAFLGPLFFIVRIANGLSHLGAAWIAKRIGLVNTMVFTHLPSSLLLMTLPWTPNLTVAVLLFLMRESLVEMDVPTRQSYIVAVVREEERTRAAGITNMTRGIAWATAPMIAGSLMRTVSVSAPLFIGPGLKVMYDLLLYREFRHIRPPEEKPFH